MQKIFTVFMLAACMASSALAARPLSAIARLRPLQTPLKAPSGAIWKAANEEVYGWTENKEWALTSTKSSTYTPEGYVATSSQQGLDPEGQSLGYMREAFTYANGNENFMSRTEEQSMDGVNWTPTEKTTRVYDSVLPGVITENAMEYFEDGSWQPAANTYRRTITRNADGNILSSIITVLYQGTYEETDRTILTYGDDGKPHTILHEVLTIDEEDNMVWQVERKLTNLVWERFDGQIYDAEQLPSATNAPKSLTIEADDLSLPYTFTYPDLKGSYVGTGSMESEDGNIAYTSTYNVLDDNGSFEEIGEVVFTMGPFVNTEGFTERMRNDSYGLTLEYYVSEASDGDTQVYQDLRGTVTYDPQAGYPTEYILTELNPETAMRENMIRVVFSNYVDAAGIAEISPSNAPRYFNLNGTETTRPTTPGLYILRQGSRATKHLIR